MAAVRGQGLHDIAQVDAVVLETDASFSVLTRAEGAGAMPSLRGVTGFPVDPS
jgi:hypothetical protein